MRHLVKVLRVASFIGMVFEGQLLERFLHDCIRYARIVPLEPQECKCTRRPKRHSHLLSSYIGGREGVTTGIEDGHEGVPAHLFLTDDDSQHPLLAIPTSPESKIYSTLWSRLS